MKGAEANTASATPTLTRPSTHEMTHCFLEGLHINIELIRECVQRQTMTDAHSLHESNTMSLKTRAIAVAMWM